MAHEIIIAGKKYETVREALAAMYTPADWTPFMGNNHNTLKLSHEMTYGGGVSFKHHLGKPLTQGLWDDLVYRLKLRHFRIYRHDETQWTIGCSNGAIINLDKDGSVSDIYIQPAVR